MRLPLILSNFVDESRSLSHFDIRLEGEDSPSDLARAEGVTITLSHMTEIEARVIAEFHEGGYGECVDVYAECDRFGQGYGYVCFEISEGISEAEAIDLLDYVNAWEAYPVAEDLCCEVDEARIQGVVDEWDIWAWDIAWKATRETDWDRDYVREALENVGARAALTPDTDAWVCQSLRIVSWEMDTPIFDVSSLSALSERTRAEALALHCADDTELGARFREVHPRIYRCAREYGRATRPDTRDALRRELMSVYGGEV